MMKLFQIIKDYNQSSNKRQRKQVIYNVGDYLPRLLKILIALYISQINLIIKTFSEYYGKMSIIYFKYEVR